MRIEDSLDSNTDVTIDSENKIILENNAMNTDKDELYHEYLIAILEERIKEFEEIQDCYISLKMDEANIEEVVILVECVNALENGQKDDIKEMAADVFQISTDNITVNCK